MKLLVFLAKGFETIEFSVFIDEKTLQDFGAIVVNEPIVVDDNIITSYCPQTSYGVAFLLLEKLTSYHEMCLVKEAMGF